MVVHMILIYRSGEFIVIKIRSANVKTGIPAPAGAGRAAHGVLPRRFAPAPLGGGQAGVAAGAGVSAPAGPLRERQGGFRRSRVGSTPCGTGQRQPKPHVFGTGPSCRTARSGHGHLRVVARPPRWKRKAKTWRNAESALLLCITGWVAPAPGPVPPNYQRFEYRWSFM